MNFETFQDFIEEFEKPNSFNFLISISPPDDDFDKWILDIAQLRKQQIMTIYIRKAHMSDFAKWKKESLKIVEDLLK